MAGAFGCGAARRSAAQSIYPCVKDGPIMMRFEGDRNIPYAPAEVFPKFRDVSFLVQCVPDATPLLEPTRDHAECRVRPGFAFIRGTMDVTLQVAEAVEPKSVRLLIASKGIGSSADVEVFMNLEAREQGTHLHWVAEVKQLGGLLKAVPSGLIRGAAQKTIDELWRRVTNKICAAG
jgi:carbon monoxide dehydrogenase subunit G